MTKLLIASSLFTAAALTVVLGCGDSDESSPQSIAQSTLARESAPAIDNAAFAQQMSASNDFAFDLLRQTRKSDENLFSGPVSISTALAMAYAGARNDTRTEMKAALRFTLDDDALHRAFNKLDLELGEREASANEPFALTMHNDIWAQLNYPIEAPFLDTLAVNYGAGAHLVDFIQNPDGSRRTINAWVAEKTEERIEELIPKGLITDETRLVLTNTIYFKASWVKAFDETDTSSQSFRTPQKEVQVDMMRGLKKSILHASTSEYDAIELPYDGHQLAMLVIAPKEGNFESFNQGLTAASLKTLLESMQSKSVDLSLPRFSFRSKLLLNDALQAMGMRLAFDENNADFGGIKPIGPDGWLYISDVVHEAFIDVNEEGSEAAAATAVIFADGGVSMQPPTPERMIVDRPFVFMIRDRNTNAVLFAGQVVDPTQ